MLTAHGRDGGLGAPTRSCSASGGQGKSLELRYKTSSCSRLVVCVTREEMGGLGEIARGGMVDKHCTTEATKWPDRPQGHGMQVVSISEAGDAY